MSFPDLQNGLYNFMLEALGLTNASNLQLIQPAVPLPTPQTTDTTVWNWMNQIPPLALIQSGSGGDQFFSDYEGVMSSLTPSIAIDFAGDIGSAANTAWNAYLAGLANPPAPTQLPNLFFNWAFTHGYYSVADKGSSDLSAMLLEPIYRAQLALQPYLAAPGSKGKPPDWSLGYAQLVSQLATAPKKSLSTANVQSNTNVSGSWAASGSSGGFLLWGGSSSSSGSSISANFASKAVSVTIDFDHALTFVPVPGAWYDSAAFGLAYASQTGSPWNPANTEVTWAKTFGPSGNMQRFASSLIVVSGMKVTAVSSYAFSSAEQTTIAQNSSAGFWPFYSSSSSSSFSSSHSFNKAGNLTITIASQGNVPTMIGMIVMPAAQYLGYATTGRKLYLQLASAALANISKVAVA
jgi:hypothetical protein